MTASLPINELKEISKRRTFAIISHPDAGKTTLTEKLLLFGGAIQMAGTVKAKRSKKFATSDWMELEKQRGISVSSSVMNFPYKDHSLNLIDTPGHEDFSEDTYRTLTAVDSALMLIDAASGVEKQTKKLFNVCAARKTPIITFINKLDRDGLDPFELLEDIETVLGIGCYPMTWPIGMGRDFVGVYDRVNKNIILYSNSVEDAKFTTMKCDNFSDPKVTSKISPELLIKLQEDLELLDGAGDLFDHAKYLCGEIAPVFFGSALNNFGVESLLEAIIKLAPSPIYRNAKERKVEPREQKFTSFIFKIQANMDPSHRDRVAFMRIVSGKFERGMKAFHVRSKKHQRLGRPTQFMAQDRSLVDTAYAGDIVGIHDPGIFKIADTLTQGESLNFIGIPVFAPEYFVRVDLDDPLKSKQLGKGLDQLSEEGAVQVFRPVNSNSQFLGVVGQLQFEVVQYRLLAEYSVKTKFSPLPYRVARWVKAKDQNKLDTFLKSGNFSVCLDQHSLPCILLNEIWQLKLLQERNTDIEFCDTSE